MIIGFDHSEQLSANIRAMYFKPEHRLRYMPGQFIEIYAPHDPMDNRGNTRIFTLTSAPHESLLSIAATFPQPGSSFKQALQTLAPGAKLRIIGEPMGDFVLPKDPSIPLVWMAGGVASASFAAMAKELAQARENRRIAFFQSARTANDLVFNKVWQQAGIKPQQTVTGDDPNWNGRRERFTARDLITAAGHVLSETMFFISGSDQMVETLCNALMANGIVREQIVREAYTGY